MISDNKLTGLCRVKMQSFWRNYKDGVLLAFILATGLGVLYDHGVSGQESVVPTAGLLIITFSNVTLSANKRSTRQMLWFSTVVISHKIDASINNAILSFISNVLIFASMSFSFSTYTPR